jgi:hypothetical protein
MFCTSQTRDDGSVVRHYTFSGIVDNKGRTVGSVVVVKPATAGGFPWRGVATRGGEAFGGSWAGTTHIRPAPKTAEEREAVIFAYVKQAATAAWKKFPPTLERVEPGAED